jgi:hypothetical protein
MELDGHGVVFNIWDEGWNARQTGAVYRPVDKTHTANTEFDVSGTGLKNFGRKHTEPLML